MFPISKQMLVSRHACLSLSSLRPFLSPLRPLLSPLRPLSSSLRRQGPRQFPTGGHAGSEMRFPIRKVELGGTSVLEASIRNVARPLPSQG